MDGNDSWSETWKLYKDQDSSLKSDVLLGLPDAQMFFSQCNANPQDMCLKKMNLTNKGLVGTIPKGFNDLTDITSVILRDNEINKFEDETFKDNTELSEIDLSFNKIKSYSGSLPTSLTSLDLANNSISMEISAVLETISTAAGIEKLNLVGNKIYGSIASDSDILKKDSLKWISLADNQIEGDLSALTIKNADDAWTNLDISYNMFSGEFPEVFKNNKNVNRKCNMFNCERLWPILLPTIIPIKA